MSDTITAPDKLDRETLYWQLMFLSSVIGNWHKLDGELDGNDTAGLATIISGIACKVFPEWEERKA